MSEPKSWEQMTMAEQMEAARNRQASFRLEAEVRAAARARDLTAKETDALVDKARAAFVFINGEPQAVQEDRKTPLCREDGGLLSVGEWVGANMPAAAPKAVGTFGPSPVALPVKVKNPFSKGSWNLTEQMRMQRRDPELAARLKNEA